MGAAPSVASQKNKLYQQIFTALDLDANHVLEAVELTNIFAALTAANIDPSEVQRLIQTKESTAEPAEPAIATASTTKNSGLSFKELASWFQSQDFPLETLEALLLAVQYGFKVPPKAAPQSGDTVLIVGAGPSGLHMAHLLQKKGVKSILLESTHRVGGKSYTLTDANGVPHEMGTCYIHPEYHVPKALFKEFGLDDDVLVRPGGRKAMTDVFTSNTKTHEAKHKTSVGMWMLGVNEEIWLGKNYDAFPDELAALPMLNALKKYQKAQRKAFGHKKFSFPGCLPPRPTPAQWELMNMTFLEFLKKNDCVGISPLLLIGHTIQGYGLLDTLPAFYGLMWFTADLAESFIRYKKDTKRNEPVLRMLKCGWSAIWQQMVKQDDLDVRLGHKVTKITRRPDGVTCEGVTTDGSPFIVDGSHVFLACAFSSLTDVMQLSDTERELFSELQCACLTTTLYEIDPPQRQCALAYWPDRLTTDTTDHPRIPGILYGERYCHLSLFHNENGTEAEFPPTKHPLVAESAEELDLSEAALKGEKQARIGYQYLDRGVGRGPDGEVDANALLERLQVNFEEDGITGVQIRKQYTWDYFYRFDQAGLERGGPWAIISQQGINRTFYIGASACFESVNDVTNYNLLLMRHFYPAPPQKEDSDDGGDDGENNTVTTPDK